MQTGEQKKIVEKVGVDWWLAPVVAVDRAGNAVTDLEAKDILLTIDGKPQTRFTFFRSAFEVEESKKEQIETPAVVKKKQPPGRRLVCLLFDLNASDKTGIRRSREIARDIITKATPGTRFLMLAIETFSGLQYIAEGDAADPKLIKALDNKIKPRANARIVSSRLVSVQVPGRGGGRLSAANLAFLNEQAAAYYKRRTMSFFYSFETLYFYLNGIDDSKFVYLLSEGVSNSIRLSLKGGRSMYNHWLKEVAENLGRGGAVLFLINPTGLQDIKAATSGEESLLFLAKESGGQYLEGAKSEIVNRIGKMQRAFYEISFPDIPGAKGSKRNITITSKRKGVRLISLRSIEREKSYDRMNDIEKEIMAVQLVSGSPLMQRRFSAFEAKVYDHKKTKKKAVYKILLPPEFVRTGLDLYKVHLARDPQTGDAAIVTKIEKETLKPKKNKIQVVFRFEKKPEETYFVLVNTAANTVRVYGAGQYEPDPVLLAMEEKHEKALAQKKRKSANTISPAELDRILEGASAYCDKLKSSVFHFFCTETVSETRMPLDSGKRKGQALNISNQTKQNMFPWRQAPVKIGARVNKYEFSYRLIKMEDEIKEEREWLFSNDNVKRRREEVVSPRAFFSKKAVFAPITLLDRERREMYRYTFLRHDKWRNRPVLVIEAAPYDDIPDNPMPTIYGDIWIDAEDFSVLRIDADPRSIRGYKQLKGLAKKIRTRLQLSLVIDFGEMFNGIRFPTRLVSLEKYKGGRIISGYWGSDGWERTKTVFNYSGYRFFNVRMDVTVEE
jgi:hypothetical protein